jgi:hypothetical protein
MTTVTLGARVSLADRVIVMTDHSVEDGLRVESGAGAPHSKLGGGGAEPLYFPYEDYEKG